MAKGMVVMLVNLLITPNSEWGGNLRLPRGIRWDPTPCSYLLSDSVRSSVVQPVNGHGNPDPSISCLFLQRPVKKGISWQRGGAEERGNLLPPKVQRPVGDIKGHRTLWAVVILRTWDFRLLMTITSLPCLKPTIRAALWTHYLDSAFSIPPGRSRGSRKKTIYSFSPFPGCEMLITGHRETSAHSRPLGFSQSVSVQFTGLFLFKVTPYSCESREDDPELWQPYLHDIPLFMTGSPWRQDLSFCLLAE